MSEARSVALNVTGRELIFLQKVTRQEYHFITDEEQQARLRVRDKLLEGFFDQNENRIVLNLGGVSYVDSSGIGELVSRYTTASVLVHWREIEKNRSNERPTSGV